MVSNALPTESGESLEVRRFTSEQYMTMIDAGILTAEDHVELIDGIIVAMSPSGSRHNEVIMRLTDAFVPVVQIARVLVQGTLHIGEGQVFDPDFMLLRRKPGGYRHALPTPDDVLLLIEVADTSLARDRMIKLPIYARAGIVEYWIVDLTREVMIVHRDPQDGVYASTTEVGRGQTLSPLAVPDFAIAVDPLVE